MPTKSKSTEGRGASAPLIDGRVSTVQVAKALSALAQHREKSRKEAGDNELPLSGQDDGEGEGSRVDRSDVVWMQLTVKRLNANAPVKAVQMCVGGAFLVRRGRSTDCFSHSCKQSRATCRLAQVIVCVSSHS